MPKQPKKVRVQGVPAGRLSERVGVAHAPVPQTRQARVVRARYDAAVTTTENSRHWANSDALSPDDAANPMVRQALRNRCRYEYANNSYCKGIGDTLANDTVGGTGPSLDMATGDKDLDEEIENDFAEWAEEIGLAEHLRTLRLARYHSGEAFGLMATNLNLVSDVKLDLQIVEPEQVTSPFGSVDDPQTIDGIEFDEFGNPAFYNVLRYHPGSSGTFGFFGEGDFRRWPAKFVLHYFRPDRPGQRRGVPDITPAAQLFAELRRYTNAVIAAAETAADYAAVIQTDASADAENPVASVDAMDTVELTRRMATVLPQGWKLGQMEAVQPTTTYGDFVGEKLKEIARCIHVPYTIAALDSSKANMSASYLDGQRYSNSVGVDRSRLKCLLNRLLDAWLTEWVRVKRRVLPDRLPRNWTWPSMGHHADVSKVASAQQTQLTTGLTSRAAEYAKEGKDVEKEDVAAAKSLNITVEQYRALIRQSLFKIPAAAPGGPGAAPGDTNDPGDAADRGTTSTGIANEDA